jgi:hypothetical protein
MMNPINPEVHTRAQTLFSQFQSARPFRHVVIDNFLKPEAAEALLAQFPIVADPSKLLNEFGEPNPKSQISDVRSMGAEFRNLDNYIQTEPFLDLVSRITGIPNLKYDPWYYGAGTHENFHGAGLDPHFDFNIHPKTGQHRRLNAIVYLNKDWDPAWKGSICFHTDPYDLTGDQITAVEPTFNRCVIFDTTEHSWHSVAPVSLPPDKRHLSRKSFTIYLYTDTRSAEEIAPGHGTIYVQPNLPEHIKAGRTLTDEDVAEIFGNIHKRNTYLKALYKREYQFSQLIDRLNAHCHELERAAYVPLLGYAKIVAVTSPLFPDRFMGKQVQFTMNCIRPILAIRLFGYRGENFVGTVNIALVVGQRRVQETVGGGVFSLAIDFPQPATGLMDVVISASRTERPPDGTDERELSVVIDRIELTHAATPRASLLRRLSAAITNRPTPPLDRLGATPR